MNENAVIVRELSVDYEQNRVLKNLDFVVRAGEFLAVIGRSGEGKTTLLNAIAGLTKHSGHVECSGRLSFVFQNNALFPWMTVRQNILFGIANLSRPEREHILRRLVDRLGIAGLQKRYPHQISGGQAQRVAIGRALAIDPKVLLMDEPFASLDYYTRNEMEEWLSEICAEDSRAILFVSHNIEEALFLADRILVLKGGIGLEYKVAFPRPRSPDIRYTPEFAAQRKELLEIMTRD